jgi:hypothetical protein
MYLFTITIHSNLFGKDLSDETLEEMADAYFEEFQASLVRNGLADDFSVDVYWAKGSLVEWITMTLENVPLVELFTANMAYKGLTEYEKIRKNVILISQDLRNFKTKIGGENLSTRDVYVDDKTKPSKKAKKLKSKKNKEKDSNK